MVREKYPPKKDIQRHLNQLFTTMVQREAGLVDEHFVSNAIRVVRGDAKLIAIQLGDMGKLKERIEEIVHAKEA